MKKKYGYIGKILSLALAFLIILQAAPLTVAGLGAELADLLGSSDSDNFASDNSVLPDTDKGQWEIPEATENPNNVDMTINNGIVYNDTVYYSLVRWGYTSGYHGASDPYSNGGWRDYTASLGVLANLQDYKWHNNNNGNWIQNNYVTTVVKRGNGDYGINKNLVTPTLVLGGRLNIERGEIKQATMREIVVASKANLDQSTFRIVASAGDTGRIHYRR